MKSLVHKRAVMIGGHKTSISLEDPFWITLKQIASDRHITLSQLATEIDVSRQNGNLSSAVRLFVLGFYRDQIAARASQSQMVA